MFTSSNKIFLPCLRHSILKRSEAWGCQILKRSFIPFKPKLPEGFNVADFKVVYSLPAITILSTIKRLKYWKLGIISAIIPAGIYFYQTQNISLAQCSTVILTDVAILMIVLWFLFGCKNLIGKIYVHKQQSQSQVVFSYLDINGKRMNRIFHHEDIKVVDHPSLLCTKFFKQITLKEDKLKLNLYYSKGIVVDELSFMKLFPYLEKA